MDRPTITLPKEVFATLFVTCWDALMLPPASTEHETVRRSHSAQTALMDTKDFLLKYTDTIILKT